MTTVALFRLPGPDFARAVLRGRGFEVEIANVASQLDGADFVLVADWLDAPPSDDRVTLRVADPASARALVRVVQSVPRTNGRWKVDQPAPDRATRVRTSAADRVAKVANEGVVRERPYRGHQYRLEVVADGYRVSGHEFATQTFRSPSAAAVAVTERSTNGWTFWDLPR